jgi:hypothetical protein
LHEFGNSRREFDVRRGMQCFEMLGLDRSGWHDQFGPRSRIRATRGAVRKIWDRGIARGELDSNLDPEVALDLILGPAMYRRATGHGGLTPADADAIVATAMRALAS